MKQVVDQPNGHGSEKRSRSSIDVEEPTGKILYREYVPRNRPLFCGHTSLDLLPLCIVSSVRIFRD